MSLTFIKRELSRDTFKYVLILAALVALINFNFLNQFKQLPSPLYGGDYYNHLGTMYHIFYGGSIFDNGQMNGEIPWVPWLYHLYVVILSKITGLDPMFGTIFSSLPLIFVSAIIAYLIVSRFTDDKWVMIPIVLVFLTAYPIYKYTLFAFYVTAPLLVLAWLLFLEQQTRNRFIFLAIAIALAHLSSTQLFFSSIILLGIIVLDKAYGEFKKGGNNVNFLLGKEFQAQIAPIIGVFIAGFIISLLYWYWPLLVYKGATPNDLQVYGWPDYTRFDLQVGSITKEIRETFLAFDFSSTVNAMHSLLGLVQLFGIFVIVKKRNENQYYHFAFLVLLGVFAGLTHHLIMFNLLHSHLAPGHLFQMLYYPIAPVAYAAALIFLKDTVKIGSAGKAPLVGGVFILIALTFFFTHFSNFEDKKDTNYITSGRQPLTQFHVDIKNWITANTGVYDVFITNNEDGFMLNALTGRKTVSTRRTHAPVYTDMDERMLDNAVMLYGKNDAKREELLKKYNVKYLFWSVRWVENEFRVQDGQLVGLYDPLMVRDKPEYRRYLDENGVPYITPEEMQYLDPAWLETYPQYRVIIAMPAKFDYAHPWDDSLDKYITPLVPIGIQNGENLELFASIYQVNRGYTLQ